MLFPCTKFQGIIKLVFLTILKSVQNESKPLGAPLRRKNKDFFFKNLLAHISGMLRENLKFGLP